MNPATALAYRRPLLGWSAGALRHLGLAAALLAVGLSATAGAAIGAGASPLLVLAAVLVPIGVLVCLVEPQLAVVVAVVLGAGRVSDVTMVSLGAPSIFKPLVALLAVLLAVRLVSTRGRSLVLTRSMLLMFGFLAVGAGSALLAGNREMALARLDDFARDLLVAFLIANLLSSRQGLRWAIWGLVGLGAALSSLSLYQGLSGNFSQQFLGLAQASSQHIVNDLNRPRSGGPFGDPNFYAQYLLLFGALGLFRAWDERRLLLRLAAWLALGLTAGAVLYTYSRGAIVALAVTAVIVVALRRPPMKLLLAIPTAALLLLPLAPPSFNARLTTLADLLPSGEPAPGLEISFRGRLSEALAGLAMLRDHPILGVGPGNSPLLYPEYAADIGLEYRRAERSTHNTFIEIAAEGGILGLGLFVAALAAIVLDLRRAGRSFHVAGDRLGAGLAESLLVALAAFLSSGLFLALTYPRGLWLLMGLSVATRVIAESHRPGAPTTGPAALVPERSQAPPIRAGDPRDERSA